jgi:hypothetical protein
MSHVMVIAFGLVMAAFSTGLYYAGISLGFIYLMMGVIISSSVLPATLTLLWTKQNKWAAMLSPCLGLCCSLTAWLVVAQKQGGALTVETLGANNPMLAGNVVALLTPFIFVPVLTYALGPDNYDWQSMAAIRKGDDHDIAEAAHMDLEMVPSHRVDTEVELAAEKAKLDRASVIAKSMTVIMTISLLVLWPIPMYACGYVFSKPFFTGWVVVGILWMFCSLACVGIFPLWEGRQSMWHTCKAIYLDVTGKKHPSSYHGHAATVTGIEEQEEKVSGVTTPTKGDLMSEKAAEVK